jgi:hypothetical protein
MKSFRAPKKVADLLGGAAGAALRKYGFAEERLITHWPTLMGEDLGGRTLPVRLRFPQGQRQGGTLFIRASGPTALEVQHLSPQIIERINGFFGYPAVAALRLEQGPVERPARAKAGPAPAPAEVDEPLLEAVADEGLRQALARLQANLRARRKR